MKFLKAIWTYITEPNATYLDYPGVPHTTPEYVTIPLKIDVTDCMVSLNKIMDEERRQRFEDALFVPEYVDHVRACIVDARSNGRI
jgi:hypothetical protein